MTHARIGLYGLCMLLLSATAAGAEEIERDFHRTFDVERGHRLHLVHGDGDVVIERWDQDKVDVQVVYRAVYKQVGLASKVDFDVEFSQRGSTVDVRGRESNRVILGYFSFNEHEHLYTVRAPSYLELDLEGEDGDVEIADWDGEIKLRNEDGDVKLVDIRSPETALSVEDGDITIERLVGKLVITGEDGDVRVADCSVRDGRIRLEDGDATFTRCEGSASFELADGTVALERFRPDSITIRTADGDVDLDLLPSSAMDVTVRTGDGDVTIDLASGSSTRFSIDTDDGGIRLDTPGAVDVSKRESRVSGRLGAGEGSLRVESGDGRVILREGP